MLLARFLSAPPVFLVELVVLVEAVEEVEVVLQGIVETVVLEGIGVIHSGQMGLLG